MKIGIVLSTPPGYSETFFTSKIKGLQSNGMNVVLFVQKKDSDFNLCKQIEASKVYANFVKQIVSSIVVFIRLLLNLKVLFRFIELEKKKRIHYN